MPNARPVSARPLRRWTILALGITDGARDLNLPHPRSSLVVPFFLSSLRKKRYVAVQEKDV